MKNDLHSENTEIVDEKIASEMDENIKQEEQIESAPLKNDAKSNPQNKKERKNSDKRFRALKIFSIASIFIAIAIVIGVNLIFDSAFGEKLQWDMTAAQTYSVSDTTKEVLANLDKDVEIVGLFALDETTDSLFASLTRQPAANFISMLEDYERHANGRITVSYVDPAIVPTIIKDLDPSDALELQKGNFVVRHGNKVRKIVPMNCYEYGYNANGQNIPVSNTIEMNFSGAITSVISDETLKAYFVTNHGESPHTQVKRLLEMNNFIVESLDTTALETIPDDCSLLIYNDPTGDLSEDEANVLMDYMRNKGGRLIVVAGYNNRQLIELPRMNSVLNFMNLDLSNGTIHELGGAYVLYPDNPQMMHRMDISSDFQTEQTSDAIMGYTRAIMEYNDPRNYISVSPVLTTSADSAHYAENADITELGPPTQLNGAMFSVNDGGLKQSKAVVFGSSYIADDSLYSIYSLNFKNAHLFRTTALNLVDAKDAYLPIQAKVIPTSTLTKMPTASTYSLWGWIFFVIFAGLIVTAIIVYNKRKKL